MPATTPVQGFSYPLASDRPCDYPVTAAALAGQLDVKGASFDATVARLTSRARVRVSRSAFAYPFDNSAIIFDTVEYNSGTPTDLSIDPTQLRTNTGHWLIAAKVMVDSASNQVMYQLSAGGSLVTFGGGGTSSKGFGGAYTPITLSLLVDGYATVATAASPAYATLRLLGTGTTIRYAALSAWWLADL